MWRLNVAHFAGAWIEMTTVEMNAAIKTTSLTSRERGLKYTVLIKRLSLISSLPSRERGLKLMGHAGVGNLAASRSLRGSVD